MKNKKLLILLLAGIPWLVLIGMIVNAYLPIFTGRSYLLPVEARDPRDFFRGNYVALSYEFSRIELDKIVHDLMPEKEYRFGDSLYLQFRADRGGALTLTKLSTERMKSPAVFLKATPQHSFRPADKIVELTAGLESFFAPPADALAWEDALRQGRVFARVSIDHSGNARLTGLELRQSNEKHPREEENK
jgi:uncharacterized membrane-anchored protein